MKNKWQKLFVALIFVITLTFPSAKLNASLEDDLQNVQNQIDSIQKQKDSIQNQIDSNNYTIYGYNSQISALYGEAQVYQKSIDEIELQIKQINLTIQKINKDIAKKKKDIAANETKIAELEKESKKRIDESYMKFRMIGANTEVGSNLLFTSNINSYFKNSQYKEVIQNDTNNLLAELASLKAELAQQKSELEEKLIEQKKQQDQVSIKSEDLKTKKSEVDAKMAVFYEKVAEAQAISGQYQNQMAVLNEDQAKKIAESNYIQQQIIQNYVAPANGQYVVAGTYIGQKGCTGLCTGPHLHYMVYYNNVLQDPCGYLQGGVLGGCGSGNLRWPLTAPQGITSGFGNRCFLWGNSNYCDFHTGIDIVSDPWNAPIFATHDGYLYKGVDPYGANYVIICQETNCSQGLKTGYWHLSAF